MDRINVSIQSFTELQPSSCSVNAPSYFVPENLDERLEPRNSGVESATTSQPAPKLLQNGNNSKRGLVIYLYVIQATFQLYVVFSLLPIPLITNHNAPLHDFLDETEKVDSGQNPMFCLKKEPKKFAKNEKTPLISAFD